LATVLAERVAAVAVIDADPIGTWSTGRLPGKPASVSVIGDVGEETIVDAIEEAQGRAAFVIVDLEGAANLMVGYAISMADFVVIPVQGSQLDAKPAARQIRLIAAQERISSASIPFAVLLTRVSPAIQPKTQRTGTASSRKRSSIWRRLQAGVKGAARITGKNPRRRGAGGLSFAGAAPVAHRAQHPAQPEGHRRGTGPLHGARRRASHPVRPVASAAARHGRRLGSPGPNHGGGGFSGAPDETS
jgi:hypothetical protein